MDITDPVFLRFWKRQKFFDNAEECGNLPVMFLDLPGDVLVCRENLPQSDEGSHDRDVHLRHVCCAGR